MQCSEAEAIIKAGTARGAPVVYEMASFKFVLLAALLAVLFVAEALGQLKSTGESCTLNSECITACCGAGECTGRPIRNDLSQNESSVLQGRGYCTSACTGVKCPAGQRCQEYVVQCIRAPCHRMSRCV